MNRENSKMIMNEHKYIRKALSHIYIKCPYLKRAESRKENIY